MDPVDPLYLLLLAAIATAAIVIVHRRARPAAVADTTEHDARDLFLRNAFERASLGIGFMNGEGQWLDANRRFLSALGYTRAELGNVPLRLMTHAEDRKREASLFAELRSGKRSGYAITKRLQRKSGEYRTFRVQMLRCAESPQAIYQCSIDDGDQQATRLELISSALDEFDNAAVIFCDATGVVSGWNRGAEAMFGYTETEIVGKPWGTLHRDSNSSSVAKLLTSAAQHGFTRTVTARVRKDGGGMNVRSVLIPDLRGRDSAGFFEVCYLEGAPQATRPRSHDESQHMHDLREDNAHLREELERHLAAVRQLAEIHTQNESLRQAVERKSAVEAQLRDVVTTLRVANTELTRKVRILSGAVRKMVSARKAEGGSPVNVSLPPGMDDHLEWSDLRGSALHDTVRRIAQQQESGLLQLRSGAAEKRLVFEAGRLVAITSDNDDRLLGQLLVDAGVIDEEQRRQVLESHRATGMPFGSSIVRMGLATEEDIAEIIRAKAKRELEDAATWSEGQAAFTASETHAELMPIAVDILAVLTELDPELSTDLSASEDEIEAVAGEPAPAPAQVPDIPVDTTPIPETNPETLAVIAAAELTPQVPPPDAIAGEQPADAPAAEPEPAAIEEVDAGEPRTSGRFVGRASNKGRTFHIVGCKSAKTIPKKQRVYFDTEEGALAQHFKPCERCLGASEVH